MRRLIDDAPPRQAAPRRIGPARIVLAVAAAASFVLVYAPLLATVHRATEILVHQLP